MPATSTETVFLPYLNAGEALILSLVSATVDGRTEAVRSDPDTGHVHLHALGSAWQQVTLGFEARLDSAAPKLAEMVPRSERSEPNVALVASLHSSKTYRRWAATGSWDRAKAVGRVQATINRSEVVAAVEFRAFLLRTTQQNDERDLGSEKAARLAWSREWRVDVDPPEEK